VQTISFSATGAAFIAYAMISIVLWMLGDFLEGFDHPENFRSRLRFIVMCGLLTVVLALIIVGGIDLSVCS
jgi:ribose/xylose/arabinose/galactoside ABC-type transport system permease subunit